MSVKKSTPPDYTETNPKSPRYIRDMDIPQKKLSREDLGLPVTYSSRASLRAYTAILHGGIAVLSRAKLSPIAITVVLAAVRADRMTRQKDRRLVLSSHVYDSLGLEDTTPMARRWALDQLQKRLSAHVNIQRGRGKAAQVSITASGRRVFHPGS
jgi:hypothetical protein